jgi:hypothetical protein
VLYATKRQYVEHFDDLSVEIDPINIAGRVTMETLVKGTPEPTDLAALKALFHGTKCRIEAARNESASREKSASSVDIRITIIRGN